MTRPDDLNRGDFVTITAWKHWEAAQAMSEAPPAYFVVQTLTQSPLIRRLAFTLADHEAEGAAEALADHFPTISKSLAWLPLHRPRYDDFEEFYDRFESRRRNFQRFAGLPADYDDSPRRPIVLGEYHLTGEYFFARFDNIGNQTHGYFYAQPDHLPIAADFAEESGYGSAAAVLRYIADPANDAQPEAETRLANYRRRLEQTNAPLEQAPTPQQCGQAFTMQAHR